MILRGHGKTNVTMTLYRLLIFIQSAYLFITGIWPLVHLKSFLMVTGPKTDLWLVKTVGALVIPIAITLFIQIGKPDRSTAVVLGSSSAIAFIAIDFYYALNDVISNVYMADGILQTIFLFVWIIVGVREVTRR